MGWIYQARNKVNGKCYVGQTRQKTYKDRWRQHKYSKCGVFSLAIRKHGWNAFEFSVLVEVPNDQLNENEIREIAERNTMVPYGYNVEPGGKQEYRYHGRLDRVPRGPTHHMYGKHLSDETKQRMSESLKGNVWNIGKPIDPEVKARMIASQPRLGRKKVDQFGLDGTFIKTWDSLKETGINGVANCCNGKSKTSKGFQWRWHGEAIEELEPVVKPTEEDKKQAARERSRKHYAVHHEEVREKAKTYNIDKEKRKQSYNRWLEKNRDELNARKRARRQALKNNLVSEIKE